MTRFLIFIFLFSFNIVLYAQKNTPKSEIWSLYNQAKTESEMGSNRKAIDLLKQILKIEPNYFPAYFAMADIYHYSADKSAELEALNKGLSLSGDEFPNGYKFLAELLYSTANYDEALKNIEHFSALKTNLSADEKRLLESCRFAANAVKNPLPFHPVNPGQAINSAADEYWPSLNAESIELVFTRLISVDSIGQKLEKPQEDFYISRYDSSHWSNAKPIGPPINTDENEGAQCISADGRLLFFTACGRADGLGSCDIYMSVKQQGKWSEPVNLGASINSGAWESQPSISADGRFLYFVSSRAGGKGKMDIWRAEKSGVSREGFPVYGKSVNLPEINTIGNEMSPFIHADGETFYFSSDYLPGMGGTDIFMTKIKDGAIQKPQNLGYPINSSGNEEGFIVEVAGEKAWFSAKNDSTLGRDLRYFDLPNPLKPEAVAYVKGKVIDAKTQQLLLPDLTLQNLTENEQIQHIYPFENEGEFLFCLPIGNNYGLNISLENYLFRSCNFDLQNIHSKTNPLEITVAMERIEKGKRTVLENIFFETDSWQLKPESERQIADMFDFMKNNQQLKFEIGGHTDNTGTADYNKQLSEKRAKSLADRLIFDGISPERILSRGYGFSQPIGDNATEEGRKSNRRTELKIIGE